MEQKILLAEDSTLIAPFIQSKIQTEVGISVEWVKTYSEAKTLLEEEGENIFLALAGLYLPDADKGEIVDYLVSREIPTIVFTGEFNEKVRKSIWSKGIIDYVVKTGAQNLTYITNLIKRIQNNSRVKLLIVDDSENFRNYLHRLAAIHKFQVFTAKDGLEAMSIVEEHSDIKLVITDYNMPNMNGFELTQEIRKKHPKEDMAIIGISGSSNNPTLSAKFIKSGANDFLNKPLSAEEFYCRVNQNIELMESIEQIRETARKDYLTNLINRRYFYDLAERVLKEENEYPPVIAMIDIDHFKQINDTYGHLAGDEILQYISKTLVETLPKRSIPCRFGGEEFCVLFPNFNESDVIDAVETLRETIASTPYGMKKNNINVTISVGITRNQNRDLSKMLKTADDLLYRAKAGGRNRVVTEILR